MYTPFFATGKVIQIPQYGKFLLLGSGIQEIFTCGIRNTGNFCLWDPEYGTFVFVGSAIREIFACGIRNMGNFCLRDPQYGKFLLVGSGIRETCLWDPEYGKFLFVGSEIVALESLIPAQGIRNPANNWNTKFKFYWQKIRNQVPGIRNPQCWIQNPRLGFLPFLQWGDLFSGW